jgi:ubiquinone/menaquinone biosynthesis C-methylase UbiE
MLDLIPLDEFDPILKEMKRFLKPGGKLVLLNMSKPDKRKTFFEAIYKWSGMPCGSVLMTPFLKELGFEHISRRYRAPRPHNFYERIVAKLWGQEIVIGLKGTNS